MEEHRLLLTVDDTVQLYNQLQLYMYMYMIWLQQ